MNTDSHLNLPERSKRIPRKQKKARKGSLFIVDTSSIPINMRISDVLQCIKTSQTIFWDSVDGDQEPKIVGRRRKHLKVKIINTTLCHAETS